MKKHVGIIEWAMRNPAIVGMITLGMVMVGVVGLVKMNKDEFPQFTIRQGVVAAVYPGSTAYEVEKQLTVPLENFLFSFEEVDKTKTYSYSEDGIAYIFVELSKDVHDKDVVWSKIKHGLDDFKLQLPSGVLAVLVKDDFGNTVSMLAALSSSDKTPRELEEMASDLSEKLYKVKGMGRVQLIGQRKEEIEVRILPERMAAYGISANSITAEMFLQGFSTLSGSVSGDGNVFPVHIGTPFKSEEEIANCIIYSDVSGNIIRLKDIAVIERQYAGNDSYVDIDGKNTLLLSLEMQAGNNIVAFGREVNAILDDFVETLPVSVDVQLITNQPQVVGDSVTSFLKDLFTSIIVVIAVMLMLFPLRTALVAGSSIPVCTMIGIALMYIFGMELNTVTLAALIMVLGMICDDSIVMLDGYISYLNQGYSRMYSALTSAHEYFPPLVLATVAICGMFYPVKYVLTGVMGDFIKLFPFAITFSLLTSIAYAVLVVPRLAFHFIKAPGGNSKPNLVERAQNKFFAWLQGGYEKLLTVAFKHGNLTLLCGGVFMLAGGGMFMLLPVQMMPKAERPCFAVEISLPKGSSLAMTKQVADSVRNILQKDDRITSITVFMGQSSPRFHAAYAPNMPGKNFAQFIVNTKSEKATVDVLGDYTDAMAEYFPQAHVRFKQLDYQAVANPIEVRFSGENLEDLHKAADSLKVFMSGMDEELAWVHSGSDGWIPCVDVRLKEDEAIRLGVTKANLSLALASALQGQTVGNLWEDGYSVPIRIVTSSASDSLSCEAVENILVSTALPGVWIPVRQVADVSVAWNPARIEHRNGERCVTVGSDMKFGKSQPPAQKKVEAYVERQLKTMLPEGVEVSYGGLEGANKELIPELVIGVLLAVLVIFLFLVFNFGKIGISLLSLISTFLCFFGAFAGLLVFKLDFGLTSVLGVVSLMGIIVRNGIIMFEHAEELRLHEQLPAREAAFLSGKRRMRPIFLTSATTALGVIPMITAGTSLWMPMGVVICFGTVVALVFIVTILPVAYWKIYETKKERLARKHID